MGTTLISAEPVYTEDGQATTEPHYTKYSSQDGEGVASAPTREGMFDTAGGAMKFESRARRVFRHGPSAAMVRQLLYWSDKGHDPEGYVYKTYSEWWDEEGLSRTELDTARHKLGENGAGVLEEKRKGIPCRLYYRLDLQRLWELMFPELQGPGDDDPIPEGQTLNYDYRVQGSDKQDCRDAASKFAGNAPSIYREYTETTSENPSGGNAPTKKSSTKPSKPVATKPDENNAANVVELDPTRGLANKAVTNLVGGIRDAGGTILDSDHGRYGGQFKRLISEDGVTEEQLGRVVDRIIVRWPDIDLSAKQALRDVLNDRDKSESAATGSPKNASGAATPEPALSALREHKKFGRYAAAAERHDFTSTEAPDWKIAKDCGNTPQEQQDNVRLMGNVARDAMKRAGEAKDSGGSYFTEGFEEWFGKPTPKTSKSSKRHESYAGQQGRHPSDFWE